MKKKIFLAVMLLAAMSLMSGCMMMSGNRLESMFGTKDTSTATQTVNLPAGSGDTVTISKIEYERLAKFATWRIFTTWRNTTSTRSRIVKK